MAVAILWITSLSLAMTTTESHANPWLPEPGKWKYYFDLSNHNSSKTSKEDIEKYIAIEREIILLHKTINEIALKTALAKDKSKTEEDKARLEIFKNHRIEELKNYIAQLQLMQQYLYHDYNLWDAAQGVEYGYNKYLSYGIESNFGKLKSSSYSNFKIFLKNKILQKDKYILTVKPHIILGRIYHIIGIDTILGSSKRIPSKKFSLERKIFQYSSIAITKQIGSKELTKKLCYQLENTVGVKFKTDTLFLIQTINEIRPGLIGLYNNILRKQFKIAQEIEIRGSKLSFNIGYFTIKSISGKRFLGSGYGVGLWIEI